jgi:hypothetical protein
MTFTVSEFWIGVLACLLSEIGVIIVAAIVRTIKRRIGR